MKEFNPKTKTLTKNVYVVSGVKTDFGQSSVEPIEAEVYMTLAAAQEAMKKLIAAESGEGTSEITMNDFDATVTHDDFIMIVNISESSIDFNI